MATKPRGIRYVILNVYGGESLHHPDIVAILGHVRKAYEPYSQRWHLTVTTTTNAIVSEKKLQQIIPYIDEFTVSYHAESTDKQKDQFKKNLLTIAQHGKRQKCVVLMHEEPKLFDDAQRMIAWLKEHNIKVLPRQLDGVIDLKDQRMYGQQQVTWFKDLYKDKTYGQVRDILDDSQDQELTKIGRACCGGRQVCADQNYRQRDFYVQNQFTDWYCSVNHFFLYVKQVTGEIFVNKDCKMNFDKTVGPIGHLDNTEEMLYNLKYQLESKTMPVIQCMKSQCWCGLCAPKAQDHGTYNAIMKKYQTN
jgi:hypothetical protein